MQDAAAWLTLAVALLLAPWGTLWDTAGLRHPDPAWPLQLGGVALAVAAALLVLDGVRRPTARGPVAVALAADLAGAVAVVAALVAADPATGTLGTVVLAVVAAGLLLQAAFDGATLAQERG